MPRNVHPSLEEAVPVWTSPGDMRVRLLRPAIELAPRHQTDPAPASLIPIVYSSWKCFPWRSENKRDEWSPIPSMFLGPQRWIYSLLFWLFRLTLRSSPESLPRSQRDFRPSH